MKTSELIIKLVESIKSSGDIEITADFGEPQIEVIPGAIGEEETLNIYAVEA